MSDIISQFVNKERDRFEVRHNNMFAFSFLEIQRYVDFLTIVTIRHGDAVKKMSQHNLHLAEMFKNLPERGILDNNQNRQLAIAATIQRELMLEIESFYLFAKIALDMVSRAIELYFGQGRGYSLDSHDSFVKNGAAYCKLKNLTMPTELFSTAARLKADISDFRDYQISHHKNPRTFRNTYVTEGGKAKVRLMQFYPTDKDKSIESRDITELFTEFLDYIEQVLNWVETSRDETALNIRPTS